jgi:hypothetical protein
MLSDSVEATTAITVDGDNTPLFRPLEEIQCGLPAPRLGADLASMDATRP